MLDLTISKMSKPKYGQKKWDTTLKPSFQRYFFIYLGLQKGNLKKLLCKQIMLVPS